MSHDLCSAALDKHAWVHHCARLKKAGAELVLLYIVSTFIRSSLDTLLAANCWKYGERVDVFHNNDRPISPAFLCKCHTQQTYVCV